MRHHCNSFADGGFFASTIYGQVVNRCIFKFCQGIEVLADRKIHFWNIEAIPSKVICIPGVLIEGDAAGAILIGIIFVKGSIAIGTGFK